MVTLAQMGSDVVATGKGMIDTTDLMVSGTTNTFAEMDPMTGLIRTGPTNGTNANPYIGVTFSGPTSFGSGVEINATSGSGDLVGVDGTGKLLDLPVSYVSGSALSDMATYAGKNFTTLGVTPGTYTWKWGSGAHADTFTLQIGPAAVPAPLIGHGLPVLLAVGSMLFGAKLLERRKKLGLQFG